MPVPGGVLVKNIDGRVIGAVGISGDLSSAGLCVCARTLLSNIYTQLHTDIHKYTISSACTHTHIHTHICTHTHTHTYAHTRTHTDEACGIAGIRQAGLFCEAISEDKECYLKAHL